VAAQGLGPADDLALVFDDALTGRDGPQGEHALAVHAAPADLDAAGIFAGGLRCLDHSVH